jgi:hypothetical protein
LFTKWLNDWIFKINAKPFTKKLRHVFKHSSINRFKH